MQLEKQRTGLRRRSRANTTGLQDAAFRDQPVKNLHTQRVVESHQPAPPTPVQAHQGTGDGGPGTSTALGKLPN